jgi:hypothetical protein
MKVYVLFFHKKICSKEKSLYYFHKKIKNLKNPKKHIFNGIFLGGFFRVGFLLPTLPSPAPAHVTWSALLCRRVAGPATAIGSAICRAAFSTSWSGCRNGIGCRRVGDRWASANDDDPSCDDGSSCDRRPS